MLFPANARAIVTEWYVLVRVLKLNKNIELCLPCELGYGLLQKRWKA